MSKRKSTKIDFSNGDYERTNDICPECQHVGMYKTIRANGPDDYFKVWICPSCSGEEQE